MTRNTAILSTTVIVLFSISAFFFYSSLKKIGTEVFSPEDLFIKTNTQPKATGNIDDAVDSFLRAANEEQISAGTGEEEKVFIISDSQEISSFSQSADENDF